MLTSLDAFEKICRMAHIIDESNSNTLNAHPFEKRNLFSRFPPKVRKLFDNGHYSEATFEAIKYLDKSVHKISGIRKNGYNLMMQAFANPKPSIKLTSLSEQSDIDEQEGYKYIFAGVMSAIRNPRGHEHSIEDDPDTCLDHLTLISSLLRRIEVAGYTVP